MEPFALTGDLEARWRTLSAEEKARAETLLGDGTAFIASRLAKAGVRVDRGNEEQAANLKSVCCAMVRRSMDVPDGMSGVSQFAQAAGPYSSSASYANPHADLYLTGNEQKLIGLKRMRAGSIRPEIGVADDTW